jgi:hypothetical protein
MYYRRPFFSPKPGKARRSVRSLLGFCVLAMALTPVWSAAADPKGDHSREKGPKAQHEPKDRPGAEKPGAKRDRDDRGGGLEGKMEHGKMGHGPGVAGAGGVGGPHHHDLKAVGKRLKELLEKQEAGKLTAQEKAELARLKQHPGRHWGILRRGLLDELEAKEKTGKLSDEEKADLEKARKIQKRHDEIKNKFAEAAAKRKERARDAKRHALTEFPKLHQNAAAVAEYKKHAERLAKLERAKGLAAADENAAIVQKVESLVNAEKARHQAWLTKNQPKTQGAAQ